MLEAPLEDQICGLIVEQLRLPMSADAIDREAPLFGEGLGLDSIDALELAVGIEKTFGLRIDNDDAGRSALYSVRTLADFVHTNSTC